MKRYSKDDKNVPMAFYYFYIYVRLPFSLIHYVFNLVQNSITNEIVFTLALLEQLTYLGACIGLVKKKYWGYIINKVLLITEIVTSLCLLPIAIWYIYIGDINSGSFILGDCLAIFILYPLMFIYFEKRKYLFEGAPQQNNNVTPQSPQMVNIRIFDKENGFFDKTENENKLPPTYKQYLDENGILYAVIEHLDGKIKINLVSKDDWRNIVQQYNLKKNMR